MNVVSNYAVVYYMNQKAELANEINQVAKKMLAKFLHRNEKQRKSRIHVLYEFYKFRNQVLMLLKRSFENQPSTDDVNARLTKIFIVI